MHQTSEYQCFPRLKLQSLGYFPSKMCVALWVYKHSSTMSKNEEVNVTQTNVYRLPMHAGCYQKSLRQFLNNH